MFGRRINYDDIKHLCTQFAEPALEIEPISTAIDKLIEMDSSRHWFSEWQLHISPTLEKISDLKSRKAQALQCRIDIIENLEKLKVSTFILNVELPDFRDFMLAIEYSNLSKEARWSQLILDYAFSWLTDLGITGLYESKFERYFPLDDYLVVYNGICTAFVDVDRYTQFWNSILIENEKPDVRLTATIYLDKVSSRILNDLRKAKESFESWIIAGHFDGFATIKEQLLQIIKEYSDAQESVQQEIDTWPEAHNSQEGTEDAAKSEHDC